MDLRCPSQHHTIFFQIYNTKKNKVHGEGGHNVGSLAQSWQTLKKDIQIIRILRQFNLQCWGVLVILLLQTLHLWGRPMMANQEPT